MPGNKMKRFSLWTQDGREFARLWNEADRRGIQKVLSEKFDISIPLVYRVRKKLGLENLCSPKHPGRRKLIKNIKKQYHRGRSSIFIAKRVHLHPEHVRKILIQNNVKIRPPYVTNILTYPFQNRRFSFKFIRKLVDEYESGFTVAELSRKYNIDQGAISKRLKAMGVELKQNHRLLPGGYPCEWCGKTMKKVWQNNGPRKQKFHPECRKKAKEFRRVMSGSRKSKKRLTEFNAFIHYTWKDQAENQINKLMNPIPFGCGVKYDN